MSELFEEYALLVAVALPPLVIVAINAWLALVGERGTLLLPHPRPYPRAEDDAFHRGLRHRAEEARSQAPRAAEASPERTEAVPERKAA